MSDPILDYYNTVRSKPKEEDPIVAAFNAAKKPQPATEPQETAPAGSWGSSRAAQARGTMDLLEGAGKGVIETGTTLVRELPITSGLGALRMIPAVKRFVTDPDLPKALEPSNTPQKVGKFAERVGEFAIGEGAVTAGAKAIPALTRAAASSPRTANIVKNAVVGGGVTGAQGGDPVTGAAIGGGFSAAGELVAPLAKALAASAVKSYSRALGASKETMKNISAKVVGGYDVAGERIPGLIERGTMALTRKGLAGKASREVEILGDQIDTLWSSIPSGEKVPAAQINAAIAQARSGFVEAGPLKSMTVKIGDVLPTDKVISANPAFRTATVARSSEVAIEPAAVRNLDRVQRLITTLTDDAGQVDVHQLRRVKQVFDEVVAGRGGYAGKQLSIADQAGVLARKEAANAIREELANTFPDVAAVNRQFHFWKSVETVMDETLRRTASQSQPMGQQIAKVAGAAAAGKVGLVKAVLTGEALGLFRKLTTSAAWNTTSAVAKDRLASLLSAGDTGRATLLMYSMLAGASDASKRRTAEAAEVQSGMTMTDRRNKKQRTP